MTKPLRVAALIDLPRSPISGGHVKGWEHRAKAAAQSDLPLDLTVYFSGPERTDALSPNVRFRYLPPVFSTAKLKFLPYVPDHTDLATYHPALANELKTYDVIHTTDGFFNFAQTAERVSRNHNIPIVNSFHTDTPAYARVFTKKTIETLFGHTVFARFLVDTLKLPERQEQKMIARLRKHLAACSQSLANREEDRALAKEMIGDENVHLLRAGVDLEMFGPHRKDRANVEKDYKIPADRIVALFVGRLDVGKNIYTLIEAMEKLIAEGHPLHLITAGIGPAEQDLRDRLKGHVTVAGYVDPHEVARLYASVDFLALVSEVEIRSIAGTEAMASALPVLVSEKSGVAPLYSNTPAMMVIQSGADNWAKAIRRFVTDSALREHMAKVAAAYGREYILSWKDTVAQDIFPIWQKAYNMKQGS